MEDPSTAPAASPAVGGAPPRTDAEVFAEAGRRAAAREPFVLCTVTEAARSVPRDAGAKMLVAPDGRIVGTVGGGPLEAVVILEALQLLRGGGPSAARRLSLTTAGDSADPLPLRGPSLDDGGGDALGMKCGGEVCVFLDAVRPAPRLLIYGAGHVGERVANLAGEIGLCCAVIDDRPAYAQAGRFPRAVEVRCRDLTTEPLGGLVPDAQDFIIILTRCHALDEGVLEAALQTEARYVGLIGSRRKVGLILRSIARRLGRDPRADLRLHAPIGLRLGDKTPGEIALSILAEVVLLKSRGELAHSRLAPTSGQRPRESGAAGQDPAATRVHARGTGPI